MINKNDIAFSSSCAFLRVRARKSVQGMKFEGLVNAERVSTSNNPFQKHSSTYVSRKYTK